jgi:hypothetical protein
MGQVGTLAESALVVGVGLAVLIGLGEVGKADLARILAVVGRRAKPST